MPFQLPSNESCTILVLFSSHDSNWESYHDFLPYGEMRHAQEPLKRSTRDVHENWNEMTNIGSTCKIIIQEDTESTCMRQHHSAFHLFLWHFFFQKQISVIAKVTETRTKNPMSTNWSLILSHYKKRLRKRTWESQEASLSRWNHRYADSAQKQVQKLKKNSLFH